MAEVLEEKLKIEIEEEIPISEGTRIEMVEYNLNFFAESCKMNEWDWEGMFDRWMEKGTGIDLYVQDIPKGSVKTLRGLMEKHYNTLKVHRFSNNEEIQEKTKKRLLYVHALVPNILGDLRVLAKLKIDDGNHKNPLMYSHFWVIHNPDMLFLEYDHPPGIDADKVYKIEKVPVEKAPNFYLRFLNKRRFNAYNRLLDCIKKYSRNITISELQRPDFEAEGGYTSVDVKL